MGKAISFQQSRKGMILAISYKIQVMAVDEPGSKGLPWADLEKMPDFTSYDQPVKWMAENGCERLQQYGLRFRIMPKDYPCGFVASLEMDGG